MAMSGGGAGERLSRARDLERLVVACDRARAMGAGGNGALADDGAIPYDAAGYSIHEVESTVTATRP